METTMTRVIHRMTTLLVTALALSGVGCTGSGATQHTDDGMPTNLDVTRHTDIAYYAGEDAVPGKHCLDVYQGAGVDGAPVLIYVHGGAWQLGGKMFNQHIGRTFAKHGIVTVSVNYRLGGQARHPAQIRDVAWAFDWVTRNIHRYGGNPDDIFITGHSAGGHLVALLALNEKYLNEVGHASHEITGVIPIGGIYRVGATSFIFEDTFDPSPESLIDASPEFHVDDDQPPFCIIYARDDLPLLDIQAIGLTRELQKHHSPVKLVRVEDRGHLTTFLKIGWKDDPTYRVMLDFIREHSRSKMPWSR